MRTLQLYRCHRWPWSDVIVDMPTDDNVLVSGAGNMPAPDTRIADQTHKSKIDVPDAVTTTDYGCCPPVDEKYLGDQSPFRAVCGRFPSEVFFIKMYGCIARG